MYTIAVSIIYQNFQFLKHETGALLLLISVRPSDNLIVVEKNEMAHAFLTIHPKIFYSCTWEWLTSFLKNVFIHFKMSENTLDNINMLIQDFPQMLHFHYNAINIRYIIVTHCEGQQQEPVQEQRVFQSSSRLYWFPDLHWLWGKKEEKGQRNETPRTAAETFNYSTALEILNTASDPRWSPPNWPLPHYYLCKRGSNR